YFMFGGTNSVMAITVGEFIGRGYPVGKPFKGSVTISGKGGNVLLITDKIKEIDENLMKYKGIIFTENVPFEIMEFLEKNRISALYNTKLYVFPNEGEMVYIDSYTGTIIR
ncbi:MAG: pyruvate kinase, partial [Thermoplasmata archaeon]